MQGFNYYISNSEDGNISFYAGAGNIILNRQKIIHKIGFTLADLVTMEQSHSANFAVVGRDKVISDTDALITQERGVVLMAQGADCPLLSVYNKERKILALIHSGWKGTKKGIIPNVLNYMSKEMGCNHSNTEVVIAPFARGCCYEVGKEFLEIFDNKNAFVWNKDKLYFDLLVIIQEQLSSNSISEDRVRVNNDCTICSNHHFSYRKEGLKAGRFGLFAWLTA